ncbi:YqgQ family protein [Bacillus sp. FJAT-49736]|uniref:YqgQ family protein n=1 Tax=Bacillus sp. FJAT-49736 TaxID=2833582 RepID=UPI001BCA0E43|nr:YqgQ family protein [Bacillus sp. FJAT-49736]MBS4173536.1 YqgQ family protein [Bacillus sp. FJAT-49736]
MKTVYDVQQLLKKFGIIIYVGNRLADLELMEMEILELYKTQLIPKDIFSNALLLLRMEIEKEKTRGKRE